MEDIKTPDPNSEETALSIPDGLLDRDNEKQIRPDVIDEIGWKETREKSMNSLEDNRIIIPSSNGSESASEIGGGRGGRRRRRRRRRSRSGSNSSSSDGSEISSTWHEHVYATPPRVPTAHMISDILGWNREERSAKASKKSAVNDAEVGSSQTINNDDVRLTVERLVAPTSSCELTALTIPAASPLRIEEPSSLIRRSHCSPDLLSQDPVVKNSSLLHRSPVDIPRKISNVQSSKTENRSRVERRSGSKLPKVQALGKDEESPLNLTVSSRVSGTMETDSSTVNRGSLFAESRSSFVEPRVEALHGGFETQEKMIGAKQRHQFLREEADGRRDDTVIGKHSGTAVGTNLKGLFSVSFRQTFIGPSIVIIHDLTVRTMI